MKTLTETKVNNINTVIFRDMEILKDNMLHIMLKVKRNNIPTCKAKKEYKQYYERYLILLVRYNKLVYRTNISSEFKNIMIKGRNTIQDKIKEINSYMLN